ncbi:MAG: hypothetical protein PHO56_00460 [Patescibacteria group bacterium]|nr:hypothetical protein [Patescibacteria group bacterium]
MLRKNTLPCRRFFVSFNEGDSIMQQSHVIMAVSQTVKKAEELFFDYFRKNNLPAFNYHTANKIIRAGMRYVLYDKDVRFYSSGGSEQKQQERKKAQWQDIQDKIKETPLNREQAVKIFYDSWNS